MLSRRGAADDRLDPLAGPTAFLLQSWVVCTVALAVLVILLIYLLATG
jgi:hypothetical protein